MSSKPSIKKNIVYNVVFQILTLIVPFVTAPYISRVLGKEGMGIYAYTYSIAHYFMLFIMLGMMNYGTREIASISGDKKKLSDKFWSIYSVQFIMGILMIACYLLYAIFISPTDIRNISLFWIFYLVSGTLDISWFYFGIENFKLTTSISAINKLITTILILTLVKRNTDVWLYVFIIALGAFLNSIVYWIKLKQYIVPPKLLKIHSIEHLKPLLVLFLPVIAANIYRYMSKLLLGTMCSMEEVGIYEAAEKIVNLPICFIAAVGTVMMPYITRSINSDETSRVHYINHMSLIVVVAVSIAMTFGIIGIADEFIPMFYGSDFDSCITILLILSPTLIIISWANVVRTQILLPRHKDNVLSLSLICGAVINIIANVLFIPSKGAIGAAWACVAAELLVCLIQTIYAKRFLNITKCTIYLVPFILIALLMYYVISNVYFSNVFLTIIIRVVLGVVVIILPSLMILKIYTKKRII